MHSYTHTYIHHISQISTSPSWIVVTRKPCPEGSFRAPGRSGECVCTGFTVDIGGKCVQGAVLVSSILVPLFVLLGLVACVIDGQRTRAARSVWTIHHSELYFDDPYTVYIHTCMYMYTCVYMSRSRSRSRSRKIC